MKKHAICGLLMAVLSLQAMAQSGTKSPYSQYGLGTLSDASQSASRGMGGVGLAYRQGNQVNTLNPASYAGTDSLTMLFDVGLSLQNTNYKEGAKKVNGKTAAFEYAVGQFRLMKGVGMAFGILPYTNVGYEYQTGTFLGTDNGTLYEMYSGDGGLHQGLIGIGWQPAKALSVGLNAAYIWGGYDKTVTTVSTSSINTLVRTYSANVNSYKLDFGLQAYAPVGLRDRLTVGATVGLGHKLGADAECQIYNLENADTIPFSIENALEIPMTYGLGLSWTHANKWMLEADVKMLSWGKIDYPVFENSQYVLKGGLLKDRYEAKIGGEWVPDEMSARSLLKRIRYRVGASYATPYYYINGKEGPKEYSVSAGFGIPLQSSWNIKSHLRPILNISAQWTHASAKDLITENTFRINLGLTFNERWFAKWKVY